VRVKKKEEKIKCLPHVYPEPFKNTKPPENQGVLPVKSDPAGIRTQDPYIKSVMLYQLSYGIEFLRNLLPSISACSS